MLKATPTETETRTLRVKLSDEKKALLAEKIADLALDKQKLEEDKAESNKEYNKEITAKDKEILRLSHQVQDLIEEVDVPCYWLTNDPVEGKKTLYRSDTMEVVETKDMDLFDPCADQKQLPQHEKIDEAEEVEATEEENEPVIDESSEQIELPE